MYTIHTWEHWNKHCHGVFFLIYDFTIYTRACDEIYFRHWHLYCDAILFLFYSIFYVWPIAKFFWGPGNCSCNVCMTYRAHCTQMEISVPHRNYGLKRLNTAAAATSATPIRWFSQQLFIVFCFSAVPGYYLCEQTSQNVCVCHYSMDLKRIARRRRQFKSLACVCMCVVFALKMASTAATFIWPRFFYFASFSLVVFHLFSNAMAAVVAVDIS